jgi:5-dehydro-2-deoxygluconokinase
MSQPLDLITVGRVSVDLYAEQLNASFAQPQTFKKSIGGSPTNVAVAAAKLGHKSAVITKVGGDPLGGYVVEKLKELGVDTSLVGTDQTGMTPVVLAALDPPEDPQIIFYRLRCRAVSINQNTLDECLRFIYWLNCNISFCLANS